MQSGAVKCQETGMGMGMGLGGEKGAASGLGILRKCISF